MYFKVIKKSLYWLFDSETCDFDPLNMMYTLVGSII